MRRRRRHRRPDPGQGARRQGPRGLLLESGGFDFDTAIQDLNRGENAGLPYYDLHRARLRFFGGTTAIWGGRTCRLDAIDFETRPWVPLSGWPFGADELSGYYRQAEARLDLTSEHLAQHVLDRMPHVPPFDRSRLDAAYWQFDHHIDRFTAAYRRDVLEHPRITTVTRATVTQIVANRDGRAVERLELADLEGRRAAVRARVVVLACGGIENARLLLASRTVQADGLGNDRGWVGRCFMEHVHCRGGEIVTRSPFRVLRMARPSASRDRGSQPPGGPARRFNGRKAPSTAASP